MELEAARHIPNKKVTGELEARPIRLKALRVCAGLAVSVVCLALAARSVSFRELRTVAASLPIRFALLYLGIASFSLFLRGLRWWVLLSSARPVPRALVFAVNSAGQMGNFLLPARLGDVFRATNLGRAGISGGFALATVFVERVLDTVFLVFLSGIALGNLREAPIWLVRGSRAMTVVACGGIAFAVLLPYFEPLVLRLGEACLPRRWRSLWRGLVEQFVLGLRSLRDARRVLGFAVLTIAIWTLDGAGLWALASGFGVQLSPGTTLLVMTALALSSAVPVAPGNLGVYQMVGVAVLAPFGVARARALALGLTLQLLIVANLLMWGLGSVAYLSSGRSRGSHGPSSSTPA